jgi:ABC-type Na+ efflux pump permease subunit
LAQVYQERRRKTWPMLAHLPVPRSRMVFAKALAGLLMYLIVFLPAGLLIVARLNTPGVWPGPIYAYMFFTLLFTFLAGAMIYLATFLSALRPARWYATKWFPLVVAIPAYILAARATDPFDRPHYYWDNRMSETTDMWVLLIALALALLSMVLVLWAIREQARTREY